MDPITREDLVLINELSSRKYTGGTITSNTSISERDRFKIVKDKLRDIADYFSVKYNLSYGPFLTSASPEANPITLGNTLHNVWSTLFKGAPNKQYAAQISFVIDRHDACLNVGFYFGHASGHRLKESERLNLENALANLGILLSDAITKNEELQKNYNDLFDLGFTAYSNNIPILSNDWINKIRIDAKNSRITVKIYPNDFDVIENSTLDFYVSQVIFLMIGINHPNAISKSWLIKPLTPEQLAKQAERKAQIGFKGEVYILKNESEKLQSLNLAKDGYPRHVALESTHHGFDILSLDDNGNDILIEVKTTTRKKEDKYSRIFFVSNNEFEKFSQNKLTYKLYRVYDIENFPSYEELDLDSVSKYPDGYVVTY